MNVHSNYSLGAFTVSAAHWCKWYSADPFIVKMPATDFTFTSTTPSEMEVDFSAAILPNDIFEWDFGDGQKGFTDEVTHEYVIPGSYDVCLTLQNKCGTKTICNPVLVPFCTDPGPSMALITRLQSYTAEFLNHSYHASSWQWDFGDGQFSSELNPIHTYDSPGAYNICLTAENGCDTKMICQGIVISCEIPPPSFQYALTGSELSLSNNTYLSEPAGWMWDFGDGNTSSEEEPVHTFQSNGLYNVCLQTFNICGTTEPYCIQIPVVVTGVESKEAENIHAFPNPFLDEFSVSIEHPEEILSMQFINSMGQVIHSLDKVDIKTSNNIQLKQHVTGIYFMRIIQRDKIVTTSLIKMN
jgi:PKD repeat protein